ncbi:MAG: hypothetical protein JWP82_3081, partial [Humibacillus sp.]|nr:hypothetical protein [Humibacillus sp.]
SDFVHVSGGFAFETGGLRGVDVDVRTATLGLQKYEDIQVKTTTFGISNASVFVGYAPGGFNLGVDNPLTTDVREDRLLTKSDLPAEAMGLLLEDVDLGIVFATALKTQAFPATGATFPTFMALKAHIGDFELVNLLPPGLNIQLQDIGVLVNKGGAVTGTYSGPGTVDWKGSFPSIGSAPAGLRIPTSTVDAEPLYADFRGPVIGVSAGLVILSISDFVHLSGGFSFIKGETLVVDINTNLTSFEAAAAFPLIPSIAPVTPGAMWRDGTVLRNVPVETIQVGINDGSLFVGYNPSSGSTFSLGADDPSTPLVDESRILSRSDLAASAIGLLASDVDFGLVLSSIIPGPVFAAAGKLPRLTTLKASVEEFTPVGIDDFLTLYLRKARVEVNLGDKWVIGPTATVGAAIDWTTQKYDADGLAATPDVVGGYGIATGTGNPPVVVKMQNYLIGGGADLFVLGIGSFVHLRGAAYFEMGQTITVPLAGVVDAAVLSGLPASVQTAVGLTSKELRFLNFGGQDIYAFLGVGGPYWVNEVAGDYTSDIKLECDPTQTGSGCVPTQCAADLDILDGIAAADDDPECRAVRNPNAIGIAVSDLDFAFAMGTPTLKLDPTRYYTLRAKIDEAALVGLEDDGLVARLLGVTLEVNISTPTVGAFPLLPVINWAQYALNHGCTAGDLTAIRGGTAFGSSCQPFGVRTGRVDPAGQDVRQYFVYEGLFVRAAVRLAQIDLFGVLVARGSLAFVLGPVANVTLTDGTPVVGVTTMTIGGANLFGFLGSGGPHWTEDPLTDEIVYTDTGLAAGTRCYTPGSTCTLVRNPDAVGLALTDLDFGLFVGAKLSPTAPAAFVAANISLGGIDLVGVPGVFASGILALSLNLGFGLGLGGSGGGGGGASVSGINFLSSFQHGPSGARLPGFLLDTGDPASPMLLDFDSTFIQVQLAGAIEIRAGPDPIVRIDGIFFLGIDLDAGSQEFRLLALGEMTIGPDIGSADPLLSIGAIGVLILNKDGVAGDFTVNLSIGGPIADVLSLDVYARVIFNTAAQDMTLRLPDELYSYLDALDTAAVQGVATPGPLATDLLARLAVCPGDSSGQKRCYTISGRSPVLLTADNKPNAATINWLLGAPGATTPTLGSNAAYLVAVLDGHLDVLGFASADVFGAIRISQGAHAGAEFELIADMDFQLGPTPSVSLMVNVKAITSINSTGLYLAAGVTINANLLQVFQLNVAGNLIVDMQGPEKSFTLGLTGSVKVLNVITLNGTLAIQVGGALGEDAWYIGASLGARFGPLSLSATGFISSWGSFSFTLSGGIDLSIAGTGIEGTVTA